MENEVLLWQRFGINMLTTEDIAMQNAFSLLMHLRQSSRLPFWDPFLLKQRNTLFDVFQALFSHWELVESDKQPTNNWV